MAKWLLWVKQEGEGCDYTVGCGERLYGRGRSSWDEPIEADAEAAAIAEARDRLTNKEHKHYVSEPIERAYLIPIDACLDLPLGTWYDEQQSAEQVAEVSRVETLEREQLAKLQAKYGR
jgi:hypothetical protein